MDGIHSLNQTYKKWRLRLHELTEVNSCEHRWAANQTSMRRIEAATWLCESE